MRTAITDARMLTLTETSVTFRWKDRAHGNRSETLTLPGVEFVRRFLRHVLPAGLRSIRYYGFCHPTAKASRLRVQLHSGRTVEFGSAPVQDPASPCPKCNRCGQPTRRLFSLAPVYPIRGPPVPPRVGTSVTGPFLPPSQTFQRPKLPRHRPDQQSRAKYKRHSW
jgi:hypothetical protein